MLIKSLKLKDFRNYNNLDLEFENAFNIIYGNNAQGKTNIIEAIFLCAAGRSHRTSRDIELVRNSADCYCVDLVIDKEDGLQEIEIRYSQEERKKISINEIPVKRLGDLMGHLNAVMFSPEDLLIIKQGPAERRRFIDITLSQLRPSYFFDLQKYAKILYQRNSLLKEISVKKSLMPTLEIWDEHLVQTSIKIMKARDEFIKRLNDRASKRHDKLTNGEESLKIIYEPTFQLNEDENRSKENFLKLIEKNREKEVFKGTTILGPHRDDINIELNSESTKIYGSQGQQRTSVLSMKLAEIDIVKEETSDSPVLLLDDVLSELDDRRQEFLLESINGMQTFITCTDRRFFKKNKVNTAFFYVENGKVNNSKMNGRNF